MIPLAPRNRKLTPEDQQRIAALMLAQGSRDPMADPYARNRVTGQGSLLPPSRPYYQNTFGEMKSPYEGRNAGMAETLGEIDPTLGSYAYTTANILDSMNPVLQAQETGGKIGKAIGNPTSANVVDAGVDLAYLPAVALGGLPGQVGKRAIQTGAGVLGLTAAPSLAMAADEDGISVAEIARRLLLSNEPQEMTRDQFLAEYAGRNPPPKFPDRTQYIDEKSKERLEQERNRRKNPNWTPTTEWMKARRSEIAGEYDLNIAPTQSTFLQPWNQQADAEWQSVIKDRQRNKNVKLTETTGSSALGNSVRVLSLGAAGLYGVNTARNMTRALAGVPNTYATGRPEIATELRDALAAKAMLDSQVGTFAKNAGKAAGAGAFGTTFPGVTDAYFRGPEREVEIDGKTVPTARALAEEKYGSIGALATKGLPELASGALGGVEAYSIGGLLAGGGYSAAKAQAKARVKNLPPNHQDLSFDDMVDDIYTRRNRRDRPDDPPDPPPPPPITARDQEAARAARADWARSARQSPINTPPNVIRGALGGQQRAGEQEAIRAGNTYLEGVRAANGGKIPRAEISQMPATYRGQTLLGFSPVAALPFLPQGEEEIDPQEVARRLLLSGEF